ncbi:MAG: hypothetical protein KF775_14760 [Cyclobacteriaceae bacterium]|nr:hypothetical protein [Cyclobacteriaceae bacterium]
MQRLYRIVNLLSIDVAVGAILTSLFFARLLHTPVRVYGLAALGLTVWIIYTADRLIDVQHLQKPATSNRHRFHQQHAVGLWVAVAFALVVVCGLVAFVYQPIRMRGFLLAPFICLYLLFQKRLPVKEFAVALFYTIGIVLPALPERWELLLPGTVWIVQLFLVALANIVLFAWFELDLDFKMGQASLATRIGNSAVRRLLSTLLVVGLVLSFVVAFFYAAGWVFTAMWLGLIGLFTFRSYFAKHERYRLWGDAIFYLPLIGLL